MTYPEYKKNWLKKYDAKYYVKGTLQSLDVDNMCMQDFIKVLERENRKIRALLTDDQLMKLGE